MHIPRRRRHCVTKKTLFCLFSCWLYGALSYALLFSSHHVCFGHAYFLMLLCFIECMFGWSFALLCDHCSHFYMTVLVYDQVVHMFYIMFTWSQFTCYIILILLLLALPWGSNVFCASVSGYRYLCSKFITALWLIKWGVLMLKSRSCLCLMFCLLLLYVLVYF